MFTSSNAAHLSNINISTYSATKLAVNKIAQVAANELAERKIRVNIVTPGPTDTGVLAERCRETGYRTNSSIDRGKKNGTT